LSEQTLCGFLAAYKQQWSARSTNNRRSHLLVLWMAATDYDLLLVPPRLRRIRKLKTNADPPTAWTVEQVGHLFSMADHQQGKVCGVPSGLWWGALFRVIYWSGCRIRAMLEAESNCYRKGEGVLVRNQKNKTPQWYTLPASCCAAIDATHPERRRRLFPYREYSRAIFTDARRIIEAAGLDCPKGQGMGLFHRLRRTNISYCAAVDPAIAQRQAGHSSYATTLKHYVDPRIARGRTAADVLPEPIVTPASERGAA
jgi:integrase